MHQERTSQHGEWTSGLGFVLAATGAAVGLGNIWKFPYIAGENGGGAFVLIYLVCIALIGVPLMIAEVMIGRRGRQNPAAAMRACAEDSNQSKHWALAGALTLLAGFLILTYYSVIAGWALDYVYQAIAGHFNHQSAQAIDGLFTDLISNPWKLTFWHTLIMLATITVIATGVQKGIERSIRFMFPTMLILMLIVVGYSMTTGHFATGLTFLFKPDFSEISATGILMAVGHAFFTLSLATGSIMMYGAYLPSQVSIVKTALFIAAADTLIALVAGLAIFPIVFANNLEPGAGPGLIFKTLPIAFGQMPLGQLTATVFFTMLVFAAFTSALSLLEPSTAFLIERFKMTRVKAAIAAGIACWTLGLGTVLSFNHFASVTFFGLNFFEALDYLTANLMLPIGGLLIALFTAWTLSKKIILEALAHRNGLFMLSFRFLLGIITPIGIGFVFLHVIGLI